MKRIGLTLMAILLVASPVISQIIHVPADQNTIQMAINVASNGDTVLVADGKYVENINFRGKTITVASHFLMDGDTSHISKTIIDGSEPEIDTAGSVVTMLLATDTTSVLCGFTIQGGTGTGPSTNYILIPPVTQLNGGGVAMAGGKIIHNIIRDNKIEHTEMAAGGGINSGQLDYLETNQEVNLIIRNNRIYHNSVHSTGGYSGGAGICSEITTGITVIEGNVVYDNTSSTEVEYKAMSGGMAITRETLNNKATAIIRNNHIYNNKALSKESFGAGLFYLLYLTGPVDEFIPSQIYNNIIESNHSTMAGGGICTWYIDRKFKPAPLDPVIMNNTIVNNEAQFGVGLTSIQSNIALFNNIFQNKLAAGGTEIFDSIWNSPNYNVHVTIAITYAAFNNVQGGFPRMGNIDMDPLFEADTFLLSANSPCIGHGVDSLQIANNWFHAPAYDYLNNPRPHQIDNRVDLGAIESPYVGYVYIPDSAFLYALIDEGIDTNGDSLISIEEAEVVTFLDVSGKEICNEDSCWSDGQITSLKGIVSFVNLDTLICSNNQLISLDVTNNTALNELHCDHNFLADLDVTNNAALNKLYCDHNFLANLDVTNNAALIELHCDHNLLTNLLVSKNTYIFETYRHAYVTLNCSNNQLTSLNIIGCTELDFLNCSNNQLNSLNVITNKALTGLNIGGMPSLGEVCVWEGFNESTLDIDTVNSSNVCFETDCNGACGTTGINEYSRSELSIFPNPTNDILTIETDNPDHYSIEINSLNGQLILSEEMEGTSHQIDLSTFQKGVYFITIRSKDFVAVRKIIKL